MSDKQIGYVLVVFGIILMFGAVLDILLVFTGVIPPLPLFNDIGNISQLTSSFTALQTQYQTQSQTTPLPQLFSPEVMEVFLNLTTTLFLMGFVMSFGYKVSNIGVGLIRPVYVKMKASENPADAPKKEA